MPHNEFLNVLKWALLVGFLSGTVALVLGQVLSLFAATTIGQLVLSAVVLLALIAFKKGANIDEVSIYEIVILFSAITLFGSIFGMFAPQVSPFILSITNQLTISGLLFTFLYIGLVEWGLHKAGVKL